MMRTHVEIMKLEREFFRLANFGKAHKLPGPVLSQAEAMLKVAEALRWVLGENNDLGKVVRMFDEIDAGEKKHGSN